MRIQVLFGLYNTTPSYLFTTPSKSLRCYTSLGFKAGDLYDTNLKHKGIMVSGTTQ